MRLGFHISIARGFDKVISQALARKCRTIQLFSRNPRGWKYVQLDKDELSSFRKDLAGHDVTPVYVHMPYLVNLATSNATLFSRSINSLVADLARSESIGAQYLIMHAGSNEDADRGISQMVAGINEALSQVKNGVILLIENTAGSGNEIGHCFEQLRSIIAGVQNPARLGVVLDTAHAFAAGYDLRTKKQVDNAVRIFDSLVGLDRLKLVHFNDSKTDFDSHRDRHWHISKGKIGKGMGYIINHPALGGIPFIMETPRTNGKEDIMNMKKAVSLVK